MISQVCGETEFLGISSLSGWVVVILREGPTTFPPSRPPSGSKRGSGLSARELCRSRVSVTSTSSRSSMFWLSRGPDPGREGVDFRVDLVPTLVSGGLGKTNWDWSFRPVVSGSGGTLTKRSSSPGLVSVAKGPVYCIGGGDESPEGVGEVNSLRFLVSGRDGAVTTGCSFWGTFIEVLDIVGGV